jgi:hypothetical protein
VIGNSGLGRTGNIDKWTPGSKPIDQEPAGQNAFAGLGSPNFKLVG